MGLLDLQVGCSDPMLQRSIQAMDSRKEVWYGKYGMPKRHTIFTTLVGFCLSSIHFAYRHFWILLKMYSFHFGFLGVAIGSRAVLPWLNKLIHYSANVVPGKPQW